MFMVLRSLRFVPALALGVALGVVALPAAAKKKNGAICIPQLWDVLGKPQTDAAVSHAGIHEIITYARAVLASPLDRDVARLGYVQSKERIRDEHISVIVKDASRLTPVPPSNFESGLWTEMMEIMAGTARGLGRDPVMRHFLCHTYAQCRFATIRARLDPAVAARPVASLTIGPYHYAIEFRSRVLPAKRSNRTHAMDVSTYRQRSSLRQFAAGPEFTNPVPGGLTNRGFFKGRVVGTVDPEGNLEPLIVKPPPLAQLVSGTWHFENDWLILRLFLSRLRNEDTF